MGGDSYCNGGELIKELILINWSSARVGYFLIDQSTPFRLYDVDSGSADSADSVDSESLMRIMLQVVRNSMYAQPLPSPTHHS